MAQERWLGILVEQSARLALAVGHVSRIVPLGEASERLIRRRQPTLQPQLQRARRDTTGQSHLIVMQELPARLDQACGQLFCQLRANCSSDQGVAR